MYKQRRKVPKPSPKLETANLLPTIYLESGTNIKLSGEGEQLQFKEKSEWSADVASIRAIIAIEPIEIDARALSALMQFKIPVVIFSEVGEVLGRIEPTYPVRGELLHAQYMIHPMTKTQILQASVWGNLRRCRGFLLRSGREHGTDFSEDCKNLNFAIDSVYKHDNVLSVSGVLGQGLKIYYGAFPKLLRYDWGLKSRHDNSPICRMLNFSYAMLEESVKTAVHAIGLNPAVGFWHSSYHQQQGLITDLASEFKLYSEAVILRLVNRSQIVPKDFDGYWEKGIPPKVIHAIAKSYEAKMTEKFTYPHTQLKCTYQELLYVQAQQLAWVLLGEIEEYYSPVWK